MIPPAAPTSANLEYTKMLFLVSHGLQSPLSAIRWGCGRLRKTGKNLTTEQSRLLEGVQQQTRVLSSMFDMLLLLAKAEEGVQVSTLQEIFLSDFFESPDRFKELPRAFSTNVTCSDDLAVKVDRVMFTSILDALFLVLSLSSTQTTIPVSVKKEDGYCSITLRAPMELSLLEETDSAATDEKKSRIVGGIPGFLLAVSASLATHIDGTLASGQEEIPSTLTLRFPVEPALSFQL